ncbi:MAG: calcium/sodium antiporter [Candidatus Dojkabacteria bacterium]|nr:MAG: calcium/sodium antiporter [Candidatus Dojkabacteria bacterium]
MIAALALLFGLIGVFIGGDFLVNSAVKIAQRLKIPDVVVGMTILSVGTTLPEMSVNVFAAIGGHTDLIIGNVIGSNLTTLLLVVGVGAIIYPIVVPKKELDLHLMFVLFAHFLLISAITFSLSGNFATISRLEGIAFLWIGCWYLWTLFFHRKKEHVAEEVVEQVGLKGIVVGLIVGMVFLLISARLVVYGATGISELFGISQSVVGLTIVGLGTSLPELVTAIMSAMRKKTEMVFGNVIGSNTLTILFTLGISSTIRNVPMSSTLVVDVGILIVCTLFVIMYLHHTHPKAITRWQGVLLVLVFLAYFLFTVYRG